MKFSKPEYWRGQLFPSPGDLPNPGFKPGSPTLLEDSLPAEPSGKPSFYILYLLKFPKREYWSKLPFPTPKDLPDPGIKSASLESSALAAGIFTASAT